MLICILHVPGAGDAVHSSIDDARYWDAAGRAMGHGLSGIHCIKGSSKEYDFTNICISKFCPEHRMWLRRIT